MSENTFSALPSCGARGRRIVLSFLCSWSLFVMFCDFYRPKDFINNLRHNGIAQRLYGFGPPPRKGDASPSTLRQARLRLSAEERCVGHGRLLLAQNVKLAEQCVGIPYFPHQPWPLMSSYLKWRQEPQCLAFIGRLLPTNRPKPCHCNFYKTIY